MRVALLSREYPPHVYGGAGVHVTYLARELTHLVDLRVRAFGRDLEQPADAGSSPLVEGVEPWHVLSGREPYRSALGVMSADLAMGAGLDPIDLVHSHTWYTNLAGHLAKLAYGIPHVMTTHSLEPLRPWKATQLGAGGYALSCFCEGTGIESADAVIAVSAAMRRDVLSAYPSVAPDLVHVIHNGVDTDRYAPDARDESLIRLRVHPARPYVLFVGRITRQKGLRHLLAAAPRLDPAARLVLCASAPDSDADLAEVHVGVEAARRRGRDILWIDQAIPVPDLIQLFSHAAVFVCPSIYEPMGIVNLEAMACGAPVVATATGGIAEVVVDGETGLLVPIEQEPEGDGEPIDPTAFAGDMAERINHLLRDPERATAMGRAGRRRAVEHFSWPAIAREVVGVYRSLVPDIASETGG
jgi:alpha-maltose-1-phosphate synthase